MLAVSPVCCAFAGPIGGSLRIDDEPALFYVPVLGDLLSSTVSIRERLQIRQVGVLNGLPGFIERSRYSRR